MFLKLFGLNLPCLTFVFSLLPLGWFHKPIFRPCPGRRLEKRFYFGLAAWGWILFHFVPLVNLWPVKSAYLRSKAPGFKTRVLPFFQNETNDLVVQTSKRGIYSKFL